MRKTLWCGLCVLLLAAQAVSAEEGPGVSGALGAAPEDIVLAEPWFPDHAASQPNWGTAAASVLVIAGPDLNPPSQTVTYAISNTGGIALYQTSGTQFDWWNGVMVPSGALITQVTIDACDTSATGQLLFGLARGVVPTGAGTNVTPVGSTGTASTPGCALFSVTPYSTLQVANGAYTYQAFVDWQGDFTSALKVGGFRVSYQLQVSPAPVTATFLDVPVGAFGFQHIEALAASGITGGCGSGNFCPNDPLTRAQMAVFLAKALGLHFPDA